jgi:leucyl-tRNA synthetase
MVLYDLGYVLNKEPFNKLVNQGMILGPSYQDLEGKYYSPNDVEKQDNKWFLKGSQTEIIETIGKIGKRYKNGVAPQDVTKIYGIDAFRLYMMYLGPLEQSKAWNYSAIKGMTRFLEKVSSIEISNAEDDTKMIYDFYNMLKKVQSDFEELKFNTAIASMIIFFNSYKQMSAKLYIKFITILAPLAPHLCEYLASKNGVLGSIFNHDWPVLQEVEYKVEEINIVFAINGKKKCVQTFDANIFSSNNLQEEFLKMQATNLEPNAKNIIIIRDNKMMPKLINIII